MQYNPPWGNGAPEVGAGSSASRSHHPGRHRRTVATAPYDMSYYIPQSSLHPTTHASRMLTQPHMAMYNQGMNGFPNPVVASAGNGTLPATHSASQIRLFNAVSSSTMYQFPSPNSVYAWCGLGTDSSAQTPLSTLQMSYESRPAVMSTNVALNELQPGIVAGHSNQFSPWSPPDLFNPYLNGACLSANSRSFGKQPKQSMASYARGHLHSKRKVSHLSEQGPPPKIFVNEERMSACLRDLNLDNNNLGWHPDLEQQPWYSGQTVNNNNDDEADMQPAAVDSSGEEESVADIEECADKSLPRLEISDQLKLRINTKDLLPKVILDEISKPQLQVVLWKPTDDFIKETLAQNFPTPTDTEPSPDMCSREASTRKSTHCHVDSMELYQLEDKPPTFSLRSLSATADNLPSESSTPPNHFSRMEDVMDDSMDL